MSEIKMSEKYKVYVDDNYHYMEQPAAQPVSMSPLSIKGVIS